MKSGGDGNMRPGFTLIELIMVIGIVMVLISLLAPTIGRVMFTARSSKYGAALSQDAKLVTIYAAQYRDVIPLHHANAEMNRLHWVHAIKNAGLVTSFKEIDPDASEGTDPQVHLNRALNDRVGDLTPGQTEPPAWAQSDPVKLASVSFPDKLIMLNKTARNGSTAPWCCWTNIRSYPGPVVFVDTHVETGYWTDFIAEDELVIENNVGWPGYSTWYGCQGRSKR